MAVTHRFAVIVLFLAASVLAHEAAPANLQLTVNDAQVLIGDDAHCQVVLVESIPENMTYPLGAPRHASTYFAWNALLDQAKQYVHIASFYWQLLAEAEYNTSAADEVSRLIIRSIT